MPEQGIRIRGTDLWVHPVGLGTNAVGGQKYYPHITDVDGKNLLYAALESGMNFWDTAYTYGPKRSEEIIGEVLKETGRRGEIILASKAAHDRDPKTGKQMFNNRPEFLRQAVEESLERLQTDYIDLFYIHFPDEATPKDEAVGALKELKDEGKIRAIGVSNFSIEQLIEANKDGHVDVYQGEYNLIERRAEEAIIPYCVKHHISFIPYFPLASGILAGKYNKHTHFAKGDIRLRQVHYKPDKYRKILERVEGLRDIAQRKEVELAQLVLASYLHHEAIDAIIPGAKRPEQVRENLTAGQIQLSKEDLAEIYAIFNN